LNMKYTDNMVINRERDGERENELQLWILGFEVFTVM
jgi:hypothetical protein